MTERRSRPLEGSDSALRGAEHGADAPEACRAAMPEAVPPDRDAPAGLLPVGRAS